jgi:hypothetical protein
VGASTEVASMQEASMEVASTEPALGAVAASPGAVVAGAAAAGDGVDRLLQLASASASRVRPPGAQVGVGIKVGIKAGIKVGDGAAPGRVMLPGTAAARSGVEPGPVGDGVLCP